MDTPKVKVLDAQPGWGDQVDPIYAPKPIHVAWVSQHDMTKDQLDGLIAALGPPVVIHQLDKDIEVAEEIAAFAAELQCNYIAVVLPPEMISDLAECTDRPIIACVTKQVRGDNGRFESQFDHWFQYIQITTCRL